MTMIIKKNPYISSNKNKNNNISISIEVKN